MIVSELFGADSKIEGDRKTSTMKQGTCFEQVPCKSNSTAVFTRTA